MRLPQIFGIVLIVLSLYSIASSRTLANGGGSPDTTDHFIDVPTAIDTLSGTSQHINGVRMTSREEHFRNSYDVDYIFETYENGTLKKTDDVKEIIQVDKPENYRGFSLPPIDTSGLMNIGWMWAVIHGEDIPRAVFSALGRTPNEYYFTMTFELDTAQLGYCRMFNFATPEIPTTETKAPLMAFCCSKKGEQLATCRGTDTVGDIAHKFAKVVVVYWQLVPAE
ncbi:MAG TPA: hypothetical protein VFJ29_00690 [Candidatus Kapabacteria bacterium]|nr:hypothetical protein [Candidatus Kapabacteria bacterium]